MVVKDFSVSYTRRERAWAEWIAWQLEAEGYSVVIDVWDFACGSNWVLEMDRATKEARRTITVLSPDYLEAVYPQPEWVAAFARDAKGEQRRLVPVLVRECQPRGLLAQITYVDLSSISDADVACRQLLAGLAERGNLAAEQQSGGSVPGAGPAAVVGGPPFPGSLWRVPYHRNPHFTGREALLEVLQATGHRPTVLVQTLAGLGGIGKTQLALEYAYRQAADYDVVWWVRADESAAMVQDLVTLAGKLNLPEATAQEPAQTVDAVRRWLERHDRWLLVLDNAEEPAALREVLPRRGGGRVLITSRRRDWSRLADVVVVAAFSASESQRFLDRRGAKGETAELAAGLGHLPLALEQAAAYVEASGISPERYLELFRTRRRALLELGVPHDHPAPVATTWKISLAQLEDDAPAAVDLLTLAAFRAPDDIPLDLVIAGADLVPQLLASTSGDPVALHGAVAAARRLSLLECRDESISIHRLVQALLRDRCSVNERRQWAEAALELVNRGYPYKSGDPATWQGSARLLPHAVAACGFAEDLGVAHATIGRLLNQTGLYLFSRGELMQALQHFQRALAIDEALHGLNHPDVAVDANNIALVLKDQGDLDGALAHARRALEIGERCHGPGHPKVAIRAKNIALILQDQGDLDGALVHARRALEIDEAAHGPEHPSVARDANTMALILQGQGDLDGALVHARRALRIDEAVYGPGHPAIAKDANNIALILKDQGDLDDARVHARRALEIDEEVYGPEHPAIARDVNNIATILRDQGDLDGALLHARRALAIDEVVFGPQHPSVARDANNIATILKDQGDIDGALVHARRALEIDEVVYGPDHPEVAIDANNIALILKDQGDIGDAHPFLSRALRIFERTYGTEHSRTKAVALNLDHLVPQT